MYDLLVPDVWFPWLSLGALWLVGVSLGLLVYGFLADQAVFEGRGRLQSLKFGRPDVAISALLAVFFLLLTAAGFHAAAAEAGQPLVLPGTVQMILGTVISAMIFLLPIGGILASLTARNIAWRDCFGLTRLGPADVLGRAAMLILVAWPLIAGAILLARLLLAGVGFVDDSPQEIVAFLERNPSAVARWVVAFFAVVVAPIQEEFLFRGYLYGVMRRYAGPGVGTVLNALLFAAIHQHLPSFGGLFVLAVCLTLAYEWSGSIFVPMAMHAMFNSLTVIDLLSGGSSGG